MTLSKTFNTNEGRKLVLCHGVNGKFLEVISVFGIATAYAMDGQYLGRWQATPKEIEEYNNSESYEEETKMERYNYYEAMKKDVEEAIKNDYNPADYDSEEEFEEKLNDELWIDDSVTGNASGSYTCNRFQAKEYVLQDGAAYLKEMCDEFGIDAKEIGERFLNDDWEWMDVSIRCYLLGMVIHDVIDEMNYEWEVK